MPVFEDDSSNQGEREISAHQDSSYRAESTSRVASLSRKARCKRGDGPSGGMRESFSGQDPVNECSVVLVTYAGTATTIVNDKYENSFSWCIYSMRPIIRRIQRIRRFIPSASKPIPRVDRFIALLLKTNAMSPSARARARACLCLAREYNLQKVKRDGEMTGT